MDEISDESDSSGFLTHTSITGAESSQHSPALLPPVEVTPIVHVAKKCRYIIFFLRREGLPNNIWQILGILFGQREL